ncbi:MAG: HupE/UreJ family protein [Campylobacterales bacterium]|nr:HupE/UreJ family protein [Campylobacterales bacterium]
MRFWLLLWALLGTLEAHQSALSYLELRDMQDGRIEAVYKKPLQDTHADAMRLHYPTHCSQTHHAPLEAREGYAISRFVLDCGVRGLLGGRIWSEGLQRNDQGIVVRYLGSEAVHSALLRQNTPFMQLEQGVQNDGVFGDYLLLGVEHILLGFDHLLFVLSLLLLLGSARALLLSITAFTLSHSLTLALSILGYVTINTAYVEAMIALSILFLARELMTQTQTLTKRYPAWIAFMLGLLHGLGFSSVLREIGLPQEALGVALLSFNLGIELGQLLFIGALSLLSAFALRYGVVLRQVRVLAPVIGVVAGYWSVERIASIWL